MEHQITKLGEIALTPEQFKTNLATTLEKTSDLTERQRILKNGSTKTLMVTNWGASSQNKCNVLLSQIVNHKDIPSVADVNRVYGNATMVSIISDHIRGILKYVGVDVSAAALQSNQTLAVQIFDTANIIASNYYYLNLMELALFFREVKSGKRGQVVWGNRLNTQELMVRLSEFVSDRALAIEKNEMEARKEIEKKGFTNIKQAGAAITSGLDGWRKMLEEAKTNYDRFLQMFPKFPQGISPIVWYDAWLGDRAALDVIFDNEPPGNYEDEIIKKLCDYNVTNK